MIPRLRRLPRIGRWPMEFFEGWGKKKTIAKSILFGRGDKPLILASKK